MSNYYFLKIYAFGDAVLCLHRCAIVPLHSLWEYFVGEHVPRPQEEALKLWAAYSMHIPIYSLTYWEFCNNLCILSFKKTSIQSCSNWLYILNIWRGKYWFLTHLRCSFVCFPERVQIPDEDFLDVFVCNVHSTDNICVNLSGGEYTVSVFLSYCF